MKPYKIKKLNLLSPLKYKIGEILYNKVNNIPVKILAAIAFDTRSSYTHKIGEWSDTFMKTVIIQHIKNSIYYGEKYNYYMIESLESTILYKKSHISLIIEEKLSYEKL